jgi:formylglycine-generating enzyme required for sulfatase activity
VLLIAATSIDLAALCRLQMAVHLKLTVWCLATLAIQATAADLPSIRSHVIFDGLDRVRISWETEPGETYFLQTTTDLALPWQQLATQPEFLLAKTNELAYEIVLTNQNQFFRVGWIDTQGPGPAPPGMALIPAGSFQMGDAFNDSPVSWGERPVHTVYVSAFYMDRHEVTKALWDEVLTWAGANGYSFDHLGVGKAANHPVHQINWYDAVKWCNARSEKEGRVHAYYTDASHSTVYRKGRVDVQNDWVNWNAGYRLPTEAEWEKAARGGVEGRRFPWGDSDEITHDRANYWSTTSAAYDTSPTRGGHPSYATGGHPYTSPVGSFAANDYGLYDMVGNVWEWSWDWHSGTYYSSSSESDPLGPATGTFLRVIRGGGWSYGAWTCRAATRLHEWPQSWGHVGFRCALPPGQP